MEDLPTDYDAIVVGTGLVESIYAAAAARVGKSVLHIDRNTHYSGEWAVLGLTGLLEWASEHTDGTKSTPPPPVSTEPGTRPLRRRELVHGVVQHWSIEEGEAEVDDLSRRLAHLSPATTEVTTTVTTESTAQSPAQTDSGAEAASSVPSNATDQSGEQSGQGTESSEPPAVIPETPGESETRGETQETSEKPAEPATEPASEGAAAEGAPEPPRAAARVAREWTINRMKKLTRRFNIDLAPKVLYSRGALVELLISSSIARYAEFRAVGQLLTPLGGQLQPVPSSRADVFTTKHVSVVEKRLLMKLLTFCAEFESHPQEYAGYEEKPFSEFLRSRRLTDNLTHHVTHAIAMVTPETPTLEALKSTQKFLRSLGRYGNTPFLWPMYGSGEIPQCFCRLCAVFGGVYHLSRGVESVTVDSDSGALTGVISDGQRFTCRHLVLEDAYREDASEDGGVSRAVIITDGPLYAAGGDQVLLIRLPACDEHPGPVTVVQVGPAASAAPDGLFVIHLTCASRGVSAEADLSPAVAQLQTLAAASAPHAEEPPRPLRVLYALYFSRKCGRGRGDAGEMPESVAFCSGPDDAIGFDDAVQEARDLFTSHFPGEEFLPRAPDPEEIIFFDEPGDSVVTGGAQPTEPAGSGQGQGQDAGATQQGGAESEGSEGAGDASGSGTEASGTGTKDVEGTEADGKAAADGQGVKEAEGGESPAAGDGSTAETADDS